MSQIWNSVLIVTLSLISAVVWGQNRPFPQNKSYSGILVPNHKSRAVLASEVKAYYDRWKIDFVKASNGVTPGGGYYIEMKGTGGTGTEKTTSEAMGYGMLITVLMAGADPQAKIYFDGLYNMVVRHPSTINKFSMSWVIDSTEQTSKDGDSATDGDMDIAYALLLADQQWGSSGTINYKAQAIDRIQKGLLAGVVNTNNNRLMLGDWWGSTYANASRPSDWMGAHLVAYNKATNNAIWLALRDNIYSMTNSLQTRYSPKTGLLPDFVTGSTVAPAAANFLEGAHDGHYDYNSARVPLRFAVDVAHNGDTRARAALQKMVTFLAANTGGDLSKMKPGYRLDGTSYATYQELTFIGPAMAGATTSSQHQTMLNNAWEFVRARHVDYFGDSLNLLSMLHTSGNWWNPNEGATAPSPTTTTTTTTTTVPQPPVTTTTLRPPTTTTTTQPPAPVATIRIDAGASTSFTDSSGNLWSADKNFVGGTADVYSPAFPIAATTADRLYNSERWGAMTYNVTVPNQNYTVILKFAENYFTAAGQRRFNIAINGSSVLTNFDVFAQAGGAHIAIDRSFPVSVTGGRITISFSRGSNDEPMINGIEIRPVSVPTSP